MGACEASWRVHYEKSINAMTFNTWVMSHTCTSSTLYLVDWEGVSNGTPFAITGVAQIDSSMDLALEILTSAREDISFLQWPVLCMVK